MVYYSWQTPSENLARVTRERAEREDDMKRGEILCGGSYPEVLYVVIDQEYLHDIRTGKKTTWSPTSNDLKKHPNVHEKDGRRFVSSGEYRVPVDREYWLHFTSCSGQEFKVYGPDICALGKEDNGGYRPILLPVPNLPEEECFSCCIVAGKFVPVDTEGFCVKCGKEVVDLNPDHPKPDGICPTCKGGIL